MNDLTTDIEIRFADLDAYGHVNNATIFTYLETARLKLFGERFAAMMQAGLFFLVAEANCRYLKPIDLNDRLVVEVFPEKLGRTSFTLGYHLHDGAGTRYAEARTAMVCFDAKQGRPIPLPEEFRQMIDPTETVG